MQYDAVLYSTEDSFMAPEEYLSTRQVADLLGLTEVTIRRLCHEGRLPAVKLGRSYRLRRADLDRIFDAAGPPSASAEAARQSLA
jgi:excisionase family DNA binding protein